MSKRSHYTYSGQTSETATIHFSIKDNGEDLRKSRKDSLLDFKRERSRSEAIDDISMSSVNFIV